MKLHTHSLPSLGLTVSRVLIEELAVKKSHTSKSFAFATDPPRSCRSQ